MHTEDLDDFTHVEYPESPDKGGKPVYIHSRDRFYTYSRRLGNGNYGDVYKYASQDGYSVVVKVFKAQREVDKDCNDTSDLVTAACMRGGSNHVLDQRCVGGVLVMESMDGDLHAFAKKHPRFATLETAIDCIQQLAYGLDCIHTSGEWYTDIKPENILWKMTPEGPYFCWGDLEFCQQGGKVVITHSPPEGRSCSEHCAVFGFGMLTMWIMHKFHSETLHDHPYKTNWRKHPMFNQAGTKEMHEIKHDVIKGYKRGIDAYPLARQTKRMLRRMVDVLPERRPGIKEVKTAMHGESQLDTLYECIKMKWFYKQYPPGTSKRKMDKDWLVNGLR